MAHLLCGPADPHSAGARQRASAAQRTHGTAAGLDGRSDQRHHRSLLAPGRSRVGFARQVSEWLNAVTFWGFGGETGRRAKAQAGLLAPWAGCGFAHRIRARDALMLQCCVVVVFRGSFSAAVRANPPEFCIQNRCYPLLSVRLFVNHQSVLDARLDLISSG